MTLHIGVQLPVNFEPGEGSHDGTVDIARLARHAEEAGLDSVWTGDRLASGFPVLDSSMVLATAAAATRRIRVGYGVMLPALRAPAWAAKQIATLQHLSGGRVLLGVAVGSGEAGEWAAAGFSPKERGRRTDRFLRALPDLLAGRPTALAGVPRGARVVLAPSAPVPEVWIGGGAEASLRRAAAYGQGWLAALKTPEQLAAGAARLAELAAERGVPVPRTGLVTFVRATERPSAAAAGPVVDYLVKAQGLDRERAAALALGGGPRQVAERLREYADAGAGTLVLVPFGADTRRQYDLFAQIRSLLLDEGVAAR
ncbi:LLM class flavin-dependent oxidoreductase [Streptomyces celluloflavus]|uniref:LLM class flavin-dependent oxidoreductase n=1 Tax=Streptomyces celluloflavus TaxID=58344 RepID=A0ABW7RKM7_9ACTN|nr:LLM class flavin-dependent oxidoreductase [Streptomyces celluloflavus]WSK17252.1 LLM class flavin-dependent oxidoreductase [Streptomyces celluloflavus]